MSQSEVIEILKSDKSKWWTSLEIGEILGTCTSSISSNLTKLRRYNSILFREDENSRVRIRPSYIYKYKEPESLNI